MLKELCYKLYLESKEKNRNSSAKKQTSKRVIILICILIGVYTLLLALSSLDKLYLTISLAFMTLYCILVIAGINRGKVALIDKLLDNEKEIYYKRCKAIDQGKFATLESWSDEGIRIRKLQRVIQIPKAKIEKIYVENGKIYIFVKYSPIVTIVSCETFEKMQEFLTVFPHEVANEKKIDYKIEIPIFKDVFLVKMYNFLILWSMVIAIFLLVFALYK